MGRLRDGEVGGGLHHPIAQDASALHCVGLNPALLRLASSRRVLLLQGPVGPFFDRLTQWLHDRNAIVNRVAFQAGDALDATLIEPIPFRAAPHAWKSFLGQLLERLEPEVIVLFGQTRRYHREAIELARQRGIAIIVLEEGYIRPGHITMELDGVNGYSTTMQRFRWVSDLPGGAAVLKPPRTTRGQFWQMARYAMRHYWAMRVGRRQFPAYEHHRKQSVWYYSLYWAWSLVKKWAHYHRDHAAVARLAGQPYFFVPLQHDGDSQITHHSTYAMNTEFIIEVLNSFAKHAPPQAKLVFRQHPFSRGGAGYSALINRVARELGVASRVQSLVEGHTPTLVKGALGVVLINSTVGFQALSSHRPLMVLGDALYDSPGLTFQGPLDEFWSKSQTPDESTVAAFLEQIRNLTQAPCNVYGRPDEPLFWGIPRAQNHVQRAGAGA